jgi:hypothetical protein
MSKPGTEFLLSVMHNPRLPLVQRMDAAAKLLRILPPTHRHQEDESQEPRLIYRIGGFAQLIDTWHCEDINDCLTRTDPCPWADILQSRLGVNFLPCKEKLEQLKKNSRLN